MSISTRFSCSISEDGSRFDYTFVPRTNKPPVPGSFDIVDGVIPEHLVMLMKTMIDYLDHYHGTASALVREVEEAFAAATQQYGRQLALTS